MGYRAQGGTVRKLIRTGMELKFVIRYWPSTENLIILYLSKVLPHHCR